MTTHKKNLTLRQIAELAGVSKSTVSRVLMDQYGVSPKTRERIEKVMRRKGFQPNAFARGLAGGKTGQVGVITRWMESGFFSEIIRGIDREVHAHGDHVLSSIAHSTEDYIRLWGDFSVGRRVDGIILVAPPIEIFSRQLKSNTPPVVLCASRPPKNRPGWKRTDHVLVDNAGAIESLLEHLVERGCRNLVHVAGLTNNVDARERLNAFNRFVRSHAGLRGRVLRGGPTQATGRGAALEFLADRRNVLPDAFVAFNDPTAYGVLEALRETRRPGARDILVTGFDDEQAAGLLGLTTIHMPVVEVGAASARLLYDRIDEAGRRRPARCVVVETELMVRNSTLRRRGKQRRR